VGAVQETRGKCRWLQATISPTWASAHNLRHTAASLAIDAGEPLHRLRDRLGHSSVLVTSRYLHV
jgi:integrase